MDTNDFLKRHKECPKETENGLNIKDVCKEVPDSTCQKNVVVSCCFLCISSFGDGILVCIHKDDDEEEVKAGIDKYTRAINEKKTVVLYNYKDNTYKKWNPFSKLEFEGDIPLVDFDSLIEVIEEIQNSRNQLYVKNGRLIRFYFAIIYKMLKDGMFGVKNNDMSLRDFVDKMHFSGFDSGQKSNLNEHLKKLEGKSPIIKVKQNAIEKSTETLNQKIKFFIEIIISKYQKKSHKQL